MVKKLLIIIFILIILPVNLVCAYDVKVDIEAFTFTVSLESDVDCERPTLQLLDKNKTEVLYIGEGISKKTDQGKYIITFDSFDVKRELKTDEYIVRVGGKEIGIQEAKIQFVNSEDKKTALIQLNEASMDTVKDILITNSKNLELDVTSYLSLSREWQDKVNEAIVDADLSINEQGTNILEKQRLLHTIFNQNIEIAILCSSKNVQDILHIIENSVSLELEKDKFYNQLTNKNWVADRFISSYFNIEDVDKEMINKFFDGAVLTGIINQLDWGKGEEALVYYASRGLIAVNFDACNSLSENQKATVYKELKKANIKDYTEIPDKFTEIVDSLYTDRVDNGKGRGGGGGRGSAGQSISTVITGGNIEDITAAVTEASENIVKFSDLGTVSWAQEAIEALAEKGVVQGSGDGKFNPNNKVTREEFVKMIVIAFNLLDESAVVNFHDVNDKDWFYPYIASAKRIGIVAGVNENEFGVATDIVRQDMAVIIYRIFEMTKTQVELKDKEIFDDYSEISDYAKDAVMTIYKAGIVGGTGDGKFSPKESTTRAQAAKMIYELLKLTGGIK